MKNVKCSFKTMVLIACGVLFLSLLGGNAAAAKGGRPALWPGDAQVVLSWYQAYGEYGGRLSIGWPLAAGADHYRLKVVARKPRAHLLDESPVSYSIVGDGDAYRGISVFAGGAQFWTYTVTVTAYSGPDEQHAHSETLQATITPMP